MGEFERIRDLVLTSDLTGEPLVAEVVRVSGHDPAYARYLIALHAGHGFEFGDVPRDPAQRAQHSALDRVAEALEVERRRVDYGPASVATQWEGSLTSSPSSRTGTVWCRRARS